jgi:hypothetical protein
MRSGLIVTKRPGKIIKENFLLEAVTTHPSAVGFAVAKDGIVVHDVFDPREKDLLDAVQKTMEKYKDSTVYFHFMKADEDEIEVPEDLQPYAILKKGDQTQLAVMLEGDFPAYVKDSLSPETNMVNEYIRKKIESIYKDSGNNLNTTLTKLGSDVVRADFKPQLMPRGVVLYIPAKGQSFAMTENKLGGAWTWGFASKNLGIVTDIVPETVKEPVAKAPVQMEKTAKPLTFKEKAALALEQAGGPGVAAPTPEVKPEEKKDDVKTMPPGPSNNPPPDTKTEDVFFYNEEGVLSCKPRTGCTWDEAKAFWKRNCSLSQPANQAEVYSGFPAANLRPNSPLFDRMKKEQMPTQIQEAMKKAAEQKTLKAKAGSDEVPGILTGEEKKVWVEIKKNTNLWNKKPEDLMAMVKTTALLTEQVQIPFEELLYSSPGGWLRLGKRDMILLAHQFRMEVIKLREQLASPRTAKIEEAHQGESGAIPPLKEEASQSNKQLTFKEKAALKAAQKKAA